MPESTIPLKGFSPAEGLWRLMCMKGYSGNSVVFNDTFNVDANPESMLYPLETIGFQARTAIVHPDDYNFVKLPTLLQMADGTWVVILKKNKREIQVETASGKQTIGIAAIAPFVTGQIIDITGPVPGKTVLWNQVKEHLGYHKKHLILVILATIMHQLLLIALPEITAVAINRALPDGALDTLSLVAAGVVMVALFQAWTGFVRDRIVLFITTRLETAIEQGFLSHLLQLPFPFLQRKTLGEMLQAFNGLTMAREHLFEKGIGAVLDGIMAIVFLISMKFKFPYATLVVVLFSLVMVLVAVITGRRQAAVQVYEVDAQAKQQGFLTELIAGCSTVKASGTEHHSITHWKRLFGNELGFELKKNRVGLWSEVGLITIQQAMIVTMLIWGGKKCLDGTLAIGTLFAFLQLSSGFLNAVFGMVNTWLIWCILRPQLSKTREILATQAEPVQLRITNETHLLQKPIVMDDVWFRYSPESPWILKGYNLRIMPGEKFHLKGASGSGKSTILRLLAGLYLPEKGTISIGGISPAAAQNKMLYLPQFTNLYGGTIIENLRVLSGGVALEQLLQASQQTGLHNMVLTMPMNYNTILPHGGKSLSGGQRQLIILTAALASNRALVILDEAMANLDTVMSTHMNQLIHNAPWTAVMASHTN